MTDITQRLPGLLARRARGMTLEAPFYTDPAIHHADLDLIFARHWIFVGVEPEIAEPGDVMSVDIGNHAVLVARDDDMELRAFHNVCRHRGARLIEARHDSVGNIVCPYHQWTYGLDGALRHAGCMPRDFQAERHGLRHVHVRSLEGLIFVCLAEEPPEDFEEMTRIVGPYVAPHGITRCKVAHTEDIVEPGNWKLTMENNRECYHCSAAHPELTRSIFAEGFGFAPVGAAAEAQAARFQAMIGDLHARCQLRGIPSGEIEHLADRVTGFRTERLPLEDAGESETLDTRVACKKLLGDLSETRLGALSFWTQPNSWHHFMSDHIVTFAVFPLTPETALLRTTWLVHQDAVEGVDYDIANLTAVWHATNAQDSALVGKAADGVRTSGYRPGPYSADTEGLVEKFCAWYIDRMQAGLAG
jgi:Rieske 2Fe-2S family protein